MNKTNKRTIYVSTVVFLLSLVASCGMMDPDPSLITRDNGKAKVFVQIGGSGTGRTVRPQVALDDVTAWELRGGIRGEAETLLAEFSGAGGTSLTLDTGTWNFTLTGYKDGACILTGRISEQNIGFGEANTLIFIVKPILEGEGTLNIVVQLPPQSGITEARVFRDGTLESTIEPDDNDRVVIEGAYPAGAYLFNIRLYKDDDLYGVVSEVVYVWANLVSEKTYTPGYEDLNLIFVIIYHLWDGETETGYYRQTAALTFESPSREGYVFSGWYENAEFSGAPVTGIPIGSLWDKRFYAKWTVAQYTVTFDADGGSPEPQPVTVNHGESVGTANMSEEPEREGHTFGGWFTAKNGGGTQFTGGTTVTEDITVYAKWESKYTVTFRAEGGSPDPQSRKVKRGASVGEANMPEEPEKGNYFFDGWYTATNGGGSEFTGDTLVDKDIIVYAKWVTTVSDLSLAKFLAWVKKHCVEGGTYSYTLREDKSIGPHDLSYDGKKASVTLSGGTKERIVKLNSTGSLFTVESGVTLVLEENITLKVGERSDNTAPLVRVNSGGVLEMKTGSKISGNYTSVGGGVCVDTGGTFTMSGGEISGNKAINAKGGVYVAGGRFTMSGGEISGNKASDGGGVHVARGEFTMSGGEISGNTANNYGGGVYVAGGMFTMSGGEIISGNTAGYGGGVFVFANGAFTMSGGEISGNTTSGYGHGGGVYVGDGEFTMSGGEISGNEAAIRGGGVYVNGGTFTMSDNAIISGNTADSGGGVYVSGGRFTKSGGGTIYGKDEDALSNTAGGEGQAVYVVSGHKKRDKTAGENDNLDSTKTKEQGGGWD